MLALSEAERLWQWKHDKLLVEFETVLSGQNAKYERAVKDMRLRLD